MNLYSFVRSAHLNTVCACTCSFALCIYVYTSISIIFNYAVILSSTVVNCVSLTCKIRTACTSTCTRKCIAYMYNVCKCTI